MRKEIVCVKIIHIVSFKIVFLKNKIKKGQKLACF